MSSEEKATREKILECAKAEFLEKGFKDASLRQIVKEAGVTTGSFYWYYKSKEELFEAVVGEHYNHIMQMYQHSLDSFWEMPKEEQQQHMGDIGGECMAQMLEYMHMHRTEFLILIRGADGTKYNHIIHELTVREIESTHVFQEHMQDVGMTKNEISPEMEHIVTSGMFAGLFELIDHDIPIEKARICVRELHDFYTAGFAYVMHVPLPEHMQKF